MTYANIVYDIVSHIEPHDELEQTHKNSVLEWIRSGVALCRTEKPSTPPKHLVAYFMVIDIERDLCLLVDHLKARLWLPPGGHVEPNEHPRTTALRELDEELGVTLPLLFDEPLFVTQSDTVGQGVVHTDVSLWYIFTADSTVRYEFDRSEFSRIQWFPMDQLPLERTDPHMSRFREKFVRYLSQECVR